MQPLLEKLTENWENTSDQDKLAFLNELLEEYTKATYYDLFGLTQNISESDIETVATSFKQLALKLHPDKLKDKVYEKTAQELFKLVNNAKDTLSDSTKEQAYKDKLQAESEKETAQTSESNDSPFSFTFTTHQSPQNGSTRVFTTISRVHTTFYSSPQAAEQKYDRDIKAGEKVSAVSEDIVIHGNVYGKVKNISGNIIIKGNVYGSVSNMSGNITVIGNVESEGKVSNMSGNNRIDGDARGNVTTMSGSNEIKGSKSVTAAPKTDGVTQVNGSFFFQNVTMSNGSLRVNGQEFKF